MRVGLIGLGIMGIPMAKNLLAAGVDLMISNRTRGKEAELVELGATYASYAEIGEACQHIILMVTDGNASKEILFGEKGVASTIQPGSIVCDMSSVTPEDSRECYARLREMGVSFLDAPVSGGEIGAIKGTMVIMAGGDEGAFEAFRPYFDILGSNSVLVGDSGAGSVAKLVNQVIVNNNIAVIGEAFVLSKKSGADPMKVFEAIRGGMAGSATLDDKLPRMVNREFKAGGSIDIVTKDLKNILATAHKYDVPTPYSAQLLEILQTLRVHGCGHEDQASMVKYFEMLADITLE